MIFILFVGFGFLVIIFYLLFFNYLLQFFVDVVIFLKFDMVKVFLFYVEVYSLLEEVFKIYDVDLVVIIILNYLYVLQVEFVFVYNCYVLVEKFFILSSSDVEVLVVFVKIKEKQFCVYYNRCFDGDFFIIKQLIYDGKFGDIKWLESWFD